MSTHRARTGLALLAVGATALAAPLVGSTATAAPTGYTVVERSATQVTGDMLAAPQIDGVAWDQEIVGNTVYAGGQFTTARPFKAAAGTNTSPRANLLAYDITTGKLDSAFTVGTNSRVNVLTASPDGKRLYVGGSFTTAGGQSHSRIAAIDTATGTVVASWAPNLNGDVWSIAATNTTVYVGGQFTAANGVSRQRLAAFDAASGTLLAWAPTANNTVRAMVTSPDASRIIIGGQFSTVNGASAPGSSAVDATTGAMYPFAVNQVIRTGTANAGITNLQTDGKKVVGTAFNYGSSMYEGLFLADATTGRITWLADCYGDSNDATIMGDAVYSVSHHHNCANINGFPQQTPSVYRRGDAFTYAATQTVSKNTIAGMPYLVGQPAPSTIAWQPDMVAGTYTGTAQAAWTAENNGTYLVLGGEFQAINGTEQHGLARFAAKPTAPGKLAPRGADEMAPAARVSGTTVSLSWKAVHDRDSMGMTYNLMRNGQQVATTRADSMWWARPTVTASEANVPAGTWQYTVVAVDPDGNQVSSTPVDVTVTGGAPTPTSTPTSPATPTAPPTAPATGYVGAVQADVPSSWWRLSEPAGTVLADVAGGNAMDSWNATRSVAGAIGGNAAVRFTGASGSGAAARHLSSLPTQYSQELWFRTTTTSGGIMMDLSKLDRVGQSSTYDQVVHMDNGGRVVFNYGTAAGARASLWTPGAYNDDAWHHVVASIGPNGARLYVDGKLVGNNPAATRPALTQGFWRVGGDSNARIGNSPSGWFNGTIDEVAVYGEQLSDAQVRSHSVAGGLTVG